MELMRVKNDVNGNPRYVVHFFALLSSEEQDDIDRNCKSNQLGASIHAMYAAALKKARAIGGKKYRGKDFGGGIVFQSYNINDLKKSIVEMAVEHA